MSFVKYIACDGCGERISERERSLEIRIIEWLPIKEGEKTLKLDPDMGSRGFAAIMLGRFEDVPEKKEKEYHFHNEKCLGTFMQLYSKRRK